MTTDAYGRVLASTDGTQPSLIAVELGAEEATRRGLPLRVVYTHPQPTSDATPPPSPTQGLPGDGARWRVADATKRVGRKYPKLVLDVAVAVGDPLSVLIDESRHADLAVIGHGPDAIARSAAAKTVVQAHGPVIVARSAGRRTPAKPDGPVVVGVQGGDRDGPAIAFGLEEAALRGVPLRAVHVWVNIPDMELASVDPFIYDLAEARRDADRVVRAALAG